MGGKMPLYAGEHLEPRPTRCIWPWLPCCGPGIAMPLLHGWLLLGTRPLPVDQWVISGNEKLRYIGGALWWVSSEGLALFDGTTAWNERLTVETLIVLLEQTRTQVETWPKAVSS